MNLTLNIFAFDGDLDGMVRTAQRARDVGVDAAIVSDLGAIARIAREAPGLDVHVSTQASTTNSESARVYKALGAKRVVLAREMTFEQIEAMSAAIGDEIELETFIHGAACMSYSGGTEDITSGKAADKLAEGKNNNGVVLLKAPALSKSPAAIHLSPLCDLLPEQKTLAVQILLERLMFRRSDIRSRTSHVPQHPPEYHADV